MNCFWLVISISHLVKRNVVQKQINEQYKDQQRPLVRQAYLGSVKGSKHPMAAHLLRSSPCYCPPLPSKVLHRAFKMYFHFSGKNQKWGLKHKKWWLRLHWGPFNLGRVPFCGPRPGGPQARITTALYYDGGSIKKTGIHPWIYYTMCLHTLSFVPWI